LKIGGDVGAILKVWGDALGGEDTVRKLTFEKGGVHAPLLLR